MHRHALELHSSESKIFIKGVMSDTQAATEPKPPFSGEHALVAESHRRWISPHQVAVVGAAAVFNCLYANYPHDTGFSDLLLPPVFSHLIHIWLSFILLSLSFRFDEGLMAGTTEFEEFGKWLKPCIMIHDIPWKHNHGHAISVFQRVKSQGRCLDSLWSNVSTPCRCSHLENIAALLWCCLYG